jgi:CheY-like chemotaxis protein
MKTLDGKHILCVEDDTLLRKTITRLLEMAGAQVHAVSNGEAALEHYANSRYNAIVTDFSMPRMNGLELIKMIRDIDVKTPIVMLSAYVELGIKHEAYAHGATRCLSKPVEPEKLLQTLTPLCYN